MTEYCTQTLHGCVAQYQSLVPDLATIGERLTTLAQRTDPASLDDLIALYDQVYPPVEKALWSEITDFHALLETYQGLFREQEALIQQRANDNRYQFILSIPVADRPEHLRSCLESILQLCRLYGYGGITSGCHDKITVVVAEDSRDETNIQRHIDLVEEYRRAGLEVLHLGQAEQHELMQAIPPKERELLGTMLSTQPREKFHLKGQAANRNLSYLKLLQLTRDKRGTLYYLVDSDQAFCVNRQTGDGDETVYALNYFHFIDRIFRNTNTLMLTGKLVGDPPVSPSVMAANFLADVHAFFANLAHFQGDSPCRFHGSPDQHADDAAYHDMANLFGFQNDASTFPYRCRIDGDHNHAACLDEFAGRLNAFFFGEHLTRKTYFSYGPGFEALTPARTIYPGNYVVNYEGLKYIIPFGHLRLRMSGPTAGRLIQAEIGKRFASVNLPMLHRRTSQGDLSMNYRPGVELGEERIDLSNEFERQFFGDLMLFSVVDLLEQSDVRKPFSRDTLISVVEKRERSLLDLYRQKHEAVLESTRLLNELVFNASHWWLHEPGLAGALGCIRAFIGNIEYNFGDDSLAYRQIQSPEHRGMREKQIVEALMNYRAGRDAWDRLF